MNNDFCGLINETSSKLDTSFVLNKLKLCNIRELDGFSKNFQHYYHKLDDIQSQFWLN